MKIDSSIWYRETYKPTKRHRKPCERWLEATVTVEIAEPSEQDFPLAFVVADYGTKIDLSTGEPEFGSYETEVRVWNKTLWKPTEIRWHGENVTGERIEPYLRKALGEARPWQAKYKDTFSDENVILANDLESRKGDVSARSKGYLVFEEKVWELCGEPMYRIQTFGLGNNHGGTSLFIDFVHHNNKDRDYFSALDHDLAVAYGKWVATNRRDTESVNRLGEGKEIKVFIPEIVSGAGDTENLLTEDELKQLLYELYKINWVCDHISEKGCSSVYQEFFFEKRAGEFEGTFEDYLEERGFNGMCYVCFDEFVEHEYCDKYAVQRLLGEDKKLWKQYLHFFLNV